MFTHIVIGAVSAVVSGFFGSNRRIGAVMSVLLSLLLPLPLALLLVFASKYRQPVMKTDMAGRPMKDEQGNYIVLKDYAGREKTLLKVLLSPVLAVGSLTAALFRSSPPTPLDEDEPVREFAVEEPSVKESPSEGESLSEGEAVEEGRKRSREVDMSVFSGYERDGDAVLVDGLRLPDGRTVYFCPSAERVAFEKALASAGMSVGSVVLSPTKREDIALKYAEDARNAVYGRKRWDSDIYPSAVRVAYTPAEDRVESLSEHFGTSREEFVAVTHTARLTVVQFASVYSSPSGVNVDYSTAFSLREDGDSLRLRFNGSDVASVRLDPRTGEVRAELLCGEGRASEILDRYGVDLSGIASETAGAVCEKFTNLVNSMQNVRRMTECERYDTARTEGQRRSRGESVKINR